MRDAFAARDLFCVSVCAPGVDEAWPRFVCQHSFTLAVLPRGNSQPRSLDVPYQTGAAKANVTLLCTL